MDNKEAINGIWQENEDVWFKWYECSECGYILGLVCDYPKYKLPTKCPECNKENNMDEATYKLTIEDAETLIAFIKMHEREEISEETWDVCMKLQDFVDDEL